MGQAKDVVDEVWAALESHDLDGVEKLLDPSVSFRMGAESGRGTAKFVSLLRDYLTAFPDLRHEELDHAESGDSVALELVVKGTHTGPLQTPEGQLAPTGLEVVWETVDFMKVRDGRVASWHVYTDNLAFLVQLGLVPAPASAGEQPVN